MTKDQITTLARQHGASYTNRHFPGEPAFAFGNEGWAKFVDALVELSHPKSIEADSGVIAELVGHIPGAGNMVVDEYKIQDRSISAAQNYCRNLWGTARGRSDWANFHDAFRAGFLEASTRPPQQSAQPVAEFLAEQRSNPEMSAAMYRMKSHVAIRCALSWLRDNGEIVFAGGGMAAVDSMNAVINRLRDALEAAQPVEVQPLTEFAVMEMCEYQGIEQAQGECLIRATEAAHGIKPTIRLLKKV